MQSAADSAVKRQYNTPRLVVHGTLEGLTKDDKNIGAYDGVVLMGIGPIGVVS